MTDTNPTQNYKNRIKNDMDAAVSYTQRKQRKHDAEMALIHKALIEVKDVETFLDAPCGTGRATILLTREGYKATGADLGDAAITVAKQKVEEAGLAAAIDRADLENLHYADKHFDAILCFRLYHHFPNDEIRAKVISEICRVAKSYVLISYLNPMSITSIRRSARKALSGKQSRQHATSLASIENFFAQNNFHLVKDVPLRRFLNTLHLAVFARDE